MRNSISAAEGKMAESEFACSRYRTFWKKKIAMTKRMWGLACGPAAVLMMAAASGAWLQNVPQADRARANPVAAQEQAIAAGSALYQGNCARCHGVDGSGRASRPPVRSARIASASDGDLFWLLKNGQPFRGMPSWARLPEDQRWQIVAYLRSIQAPANDKQ
jgi:mono/diheme cytochrome c family protein